MKYIIILRSILIGGAIGTAFGIAIAPDNLTHALVFGNIGTWTGAISAFLAVVCLPKSETFCTQPHAQPHAQAVETREDS